MKFNKIFLVLLILMSYVSAEDVSTAVQATEFEICKVFDNVFWLIYMILFPLTLILWPTGFIAILVLGFLGKSNKTLYYAVAWFISCPILSIIALVLIWILKIVFSGGECSP